MKVDPASRIIYDFGANNGDDIPYYLLKSDRVVAVEANPLLCQHIRKRFPQALDAGALVVENCVLDVGASSAQVPFFIHRKNHVLSQFPRPAASILHQFGEVRLPSTNVVELIERHGAPFYVKIDVENFDQAILKALFSHGIRPPYISAESHSIQVFAALVALGEYKAFKLVDGASVSVKYKGHEISTATGTGKYSFPYHSAGPFGGDITGPWMSPDGFFRLLRREGLGWKDIHASRVDEAGAP